MRQSPDPTIVLQERQGNAGQAIAAADPGQAPAAMIGLTALERQSQAASRCIDSIRRPSFPATPGPARPEPSWGCARLTRAEPDR
jgi:hypothetical protein